MLIDILLFCAGLALVVFGADWLVNGASKLAHRLRVSELVIGLVIVAFGTSMPEMVVSAGASLKGANDIAIANVVGSNIFNLLLILGVAGMIHPMAVNKSITRMDLPVSLAGALILLAFGLLPLNDGQTIVSWWEGLIMLAVFALYMTYVIRMAMQNRKDSEAETSTENSKLYVSLGLIALGLAGLIGGGNLLVDSAISLAHRWGMSEKFIGMTIVAMGTSLPELATSVVAAVQRKNDIAIANVVGSNIFNILFIIPICSLISPTSYSPAFNFDLLFLSASTVVFWLCTFRSGQQQRWCSGLLLLLYIVFMARTFVMG